MAEVRLQRPRGPRRLGSVHRGLRSPTSDPNARGESADSRGCAGRKRCPPAERRRMAHPVDGKVFGAGSLSQPRRRGPMRTDPEKSTQASAAWTKFPMRRESFWRDSIVVAVIVVLGAYALSLIANLGVGSVPASKAIETIGLILFLAVLILAFVLLLYYGDRAESIP